ncbi:Predicted metal-binding integral membrane protein [Arthrobacter sp. ov407]|nr:Predicted metal-binding integral membrane protein [Arthrobacter sp. ov407]
MPGRSGLTVSHHAAELALIGCAALAWYLTFVGLTDMSTGPGTMGLGLWGFLGVWTLMMAAMMLPALAPLTSTYLRSIRAVRSRRVRTIRTTGLVGGYLLTWIGFGVVAYAAAALSGLLAEDSANIAPWVGAGVLVAAGAYQLTPLKDFCLRHCRSPVAFLLHVSGYKGRLRDVRVGMYHGVYCVGCCWGLMVVLIAVGVMNLAWMAVLTVVIFLEKTWKYGPTLSRITGVSLIVFALFVPSHPELLPGLYMTSPM